MNVINCLFLKELVSLGKGGGGVLQSREKSFRSAEDIKVNKIRIRSMSCVILRTCEDKFFVK